MSIDMIQSVSITVLGLVSIVTSISVILLARTLRRQARPDGNPRADARGAAEPIRDPRGR